MFKESYLIIQNKIGIRFIKCIHVFGGFYIKYAKIGKFLYGVIPNRRKKHFILVKNFSTALFTASRKEYKRKNGIYIKMPENKALLLDEQGKILGKKIKGNIDITLIKYSCLKIIANLKIYI